MSGTQGGCAPEAQTQTQTRTQAPVREHMFKRPPPYPQPQQPQIPEHLEYQYTLREYGLPLWPLQRTPHASHPPPPPLPPQIPKEEELSADLSRQEARRLQRGQLQQKIKIKQIRMLQRRIQKNTMEIESLQNQMKSLELLMARPPQIQPQLQPRPRPHPQLRKQQAFDLYRPYI